MNNKEEIENLLTPSLSGGSNQIYSTSPMFAVAFFGGMFGVPLLAGLNSYYLKRLKKDTIWLVLALFAALVVTYVMVEYSSSDELKNNFRLANRGFAFALFAGFWLLHRRFYRAQTNSSAKPRSPWVAAIACSIIGMIIAISAITILILLKGQP